MNNMRIVKWPFVLGFLITGLMAMSLHVFILLYAPPPIDHISVNGTLRYSIRLATIGGALIVALLSYDYWQDLKWPYRILFFTIFMLALTEELFRGPFMDILCGTPWREQLTYSLAIYLAYLSFSTLIFLGVPHIQAHKFKWLNYSILILIATCIDIAIRGIIHTLLAPTTMASAQQTSPASYGPNILLAAYVTFIEPTLAAFFLYNLIKKSLIGLSMAVKTFTVWGIFCLIHAGFFFMTQILYSDGHIFYRIFYYGQFLWEYLALSFGSVYCSDRWLIPQF